MKYILGLGRNPRLQKEIAPKMEASQQECEKAARRFKTLKNHTRERRVVAKAEHLPGVRGYSTRFVV